MPFRRKFHRLLVWMGCAATLAVGSAFGPPVKPAMTVVIDAGHGGKDPGNLGTGRYKTAEKDVTLAVARKTRDYIESRIPGVQVLMTRTGDTYPSLPDRVRLANDAQADLLLSIHCDSFAKSSASGSSSFVMGLDKSEASLRVAAKENAAIFEEEDRQGFDPDDPDTFIALALKQEIFLDRSLQLANLIQGQFRERVGRKDRGVRQANYYVTAYASMPSVLVELGFLTNPEEEDFLLSSQGQDYMASALFRAFRDYASHWFDLETSVQLQNAPDADQVEDHTEETVSSAHTADDADEDIDSTESSPAHGSPSPTPSWFSVLSGACDGDLCFSVQVASKKEDGTLQLGNHAIPFTTAQRVGSVYKYRVGNTASYVDACQMRDTLRMNGFPDAFVLAFKKGQRIPLQEALK